MSFACLKQSRKVGRPIHLKQIAQNPVWQMEGVVDIDTQLEVVQLRMWSRPERVHAATPALAGRRPW